MEKTLAVLELVGLSILMILKYVAVLLILPVAVVALSWSFGVDVFNAMLVVGFGAALCYYLWRSIRAHS